MDEVTPCPGGSSDSFVLTARSPREKFFSKLGVCGRRVNQDTVWKPREERPKQSCTQIIFDWDDTLLCTTAIQSETSPTEQELADLAFAAVRLVSVAKTLGTVVIITNALREWVTFSCDRYVPALAEVIRDIEVVSARERFEDRYPDDPTQWKIQAFCELTENSQTIANLLAVGDSTAEMEALHAMAQLYHISYTKTVKFKTRPTCRELQAEISLVTPRLKTIITSVKDYNIKLSQRPSQG